MTLEHSPDALTSIQRGGEALIAIGLLLLTGFFVLHQVQATGFFTAKFGTLEALLLYAPLVLAIVDAGLQALSGRAQPARPFAAASGLLLGVAAVWFLLVAFPFDFFHLGDVLPEGLRGLLAWVTNDLGKIPLVIQVIAGPLTAIRAIMAFLAYRG